MSRLFLLFLTSIVLIGCSQFAEYEARSKYLDGKVIVDNEEYNLTQGFYTYKDEEVEINILTPFTPMEAADHFDTLTVKKIVK